MYRNHKKKYEKKIIKKQKYCECLSVKKMRVIRGQMLYGVKNIRLFSLLPILRRRYSLVPVCARSALTYSNNASIHDRHNLVIVNV